MDKNGNSDGNIDDKIYSIQIGENMRHLIFLLFLMICSDVYADRVCIRKSDGFPIEYQTGNAPLGTLENNAMNAGYSAGEIEEKYISAGAYANLQENMIDKPLREVKKAKNKTAVDRIKVKLNLSDQDWEDLINVLRD